MHKNLHGGHTRDQQFIELKDMILERDNLPGIVNAGIAKARAIPMSVAFRRVSRQPTNNRPVSVVCYDPRLPSLAKITTKHWRSMVGEDSYLESVFPEPPLVSYKRQKNIRETIVKGSEGLFKEKTLNRLMVPYCYYHGIDT